jgi:hypothetical protein
VDDGKIVCLGKTERMFNKIKECGKIVEKYQLRLVSTRHTSDIITEAVTTTATSARTGTMELLQPFP